MYRWGLEFVQTIGTVIRVRRDPGERRVGTNREGEDCYIREQTWYRIRE